MLLLTWCVFEKSTLKRERENSSAFFLLSVSFRHKFSSAEILDILDPLPQTFGSPCSCGFAVSVTQPNSLETRRFESAGHFPSEEYKCTVYASDLLPLTGVFADESVFLMTLQGSIQSLSCSNSRKASCRTDVCAQHLSEV